MDETLSAMVLKLVLIVAGCLLALAVAVANAALLIPLAGILGGTALAWRVLGVWGGARASPTPTDSAGLDQRLQLLADEVEALRTEQTRLQTTLRWQEQLLDRLAGGDLIGDCSGEDDDAGHRAKLRPGRAERQSSDGAASGISLELSTQPVRPPSSTTRDQTPYSARTRATSPTSALPARSAPRAGLTASGAAECTTTRSRALRRSTW